VAEVADDLGCDWHTVMDGVALYGTPLIEDPDRFGTVHALGLDETLFCREGRFRIQCWSTQIVDVRCGQLLNVVEGRDSSEPCRWLAARSDEWRAGVEWATLDLSMSYRAVFDTMLPDAVQVADPVPRREARQHRARGVPVPVHRKRRPRCKKRCSSRSPTC
jgi:transposase